MIDAPSWASASEVEEFGRLFLAASFVGRAHFEHFKATGDLRRPGSARRAAKRAADPIATQREALRKRLEGTQRAIKDAERKIAQARADATASQMLFGYKAEMAIKAQQARIAERMVALRAAQLDLDLFDTLHPR